MNLRAVQVEPAAPQQARNRQPTRWVRAGLAAVLLLYVVMSCVGITWGLPSRKIDKFLFAEGLAWPGEKIYRLAKAGEKFSAERTQSTGADVDVDPLDSSRNILPSSQLSPLRGEGGMVRQEPRPPLLLTGT